jgi:hypothetical protein
MVVTINRPELDRLIDLMFKQKPGLNGTHVKEVVSGWATVDVPNWEGSRPDLYSLSQGRIYGPESYSRIAHTTGGKP